MVATSGTQNGKRWILARSLIALFAEADRINPHRDTASDGSIGDPAHQSRVSDHNPSMGWVCAADVDEDGVDVDLLRQHLTATGDSRVKYIIRNKTIYKASTNFAPEVYRGANPHDKHIHISIFNTIAARDDTRPWWPQEDDMPLTDADILKVAAAVRTALEPDLTRIFKQIVDDETVRADIRLNREIAKAVGAPTPPAPPAT